jgi:hypothetical protein
MCVIEKVTDVYPDHVRTRRTIYRCPFSDGNDLCSLTRIHDLGEISHGQSSQYDPARTSSGYETSASVEGGSRNRYSGNTWRFTYKDLMRIFHRPFTRTSREPRNQHMQDGRIREDTQHSYPTFRGPGSSRRISEMHPNQPAVARSSALREIFPTRSTERRSSPPPYVTMRPRRPRERSPVVERIPVIRPRTAPSRPVIIHNPYPYQDPIEAAGVSGSPDTPPHRHVRFAAPTDYEVRRPDARNNASNGRRQRQSIRQEIYRARELAQDSRRQRRHAGEETERSRRFINQHSSRLWPSGQRINRQADVPTYSTEPPQRGVPPVIIQDGIRQLRDQGMRIIANARARYGGETFSRSNHGHRSSEDHFRD